MWDDPIVNEVRRVRDQLARKFDYDLKAIFDDIRERQKNLGDRLIILNKNESKHIENKTS